MVPYCVHRGFLGSFVFNGIQHRSLICMTLTATVEVRISYRCVGEHVDDDPFGVSHIVLLTSYRTILDAISDLGL
jgi:hypothetical protein